MKLTISWDSSVSQNNSRSFSGCQNCRQLAPRHAHGMLITMSDITFILEAIEQGDPHASDQLLPLVYDELRKLAAQKMAQEAPGQTLQATALVHEAYVRLVGANSEQSWKSRGHFLCAAAEAMRRILIEQARRKGCVKHGGSRRPYGKKTQPGTKTSGE
jgi:RNA polymerase sigma factor (TIGR02999 family)